MTGRVRSSWVKADIPLFAIPAKQGGIGRPSISPIARYDSIILKTADTISLVSISLC